MYFHNALREKFSVILSMHLCRILFTHFGIQDFVVHINLEVIYLLLTVLKKHKKNHKRNEPISFLHIKLSLKFEFSKKPITKAPFSTISLSYPFLSKI